MKLFGFNVKLQSPQRLVSVEDYRQEARRKLPDLAWAYVDGAAEDLVTLRDNRNGFSAWSLRDRVLTAKGKPDLSTTAMGLPISMPVMLAPTAYSALCNWQGDLHAARAVRTMGTRLVASTAASWALEDIAEAGGQEIGFQLYPREGDVASGLMNRAWQAGVKSIFLTVDTATVGIREAERRHGMTFPPTMTPKTMLDLALHPRWSLAALRHKRISAGNFADGSAVTMSRMVKAMEIESRHFTQLMLSWDDFSWMRDRWKGRIYLKGAMEPADAEKAVSLGADGIVVSNHGGRQLEYARSSISALPGVVAAVGNRAEVILDSGVRRGTDVVKAVALGAKAVLIGRPWLYGAAVGGQEGVEGVLEILRNEIEVALTLMGVGSVQELSPDWLVPRNQPPQERGDSSTVHDRTIRPVGRY